MLECNGRGGIADPLDDFLEKSILPTHLIELDLAGAGLVERSLINFVPKCSTLRALRIAIYPSFSSPVPLKSVQYLEIDFHISLSIVAYAPNLVHLRFNYG